MYFMTAQTVAAQGWVPTDDTFAVRLAMTRTLMGWSNVKEAALACGIPVESWRGWETRGMLPRRYTEITAMIADATRRIDGRGVDQDWLMRGTPRGTECTVRDSNPEPADCGSSAGQLLVVTATRWSLPCQRKGGRTGDLDHHLFGSWFGASSTIPA